MPTSTTVLEVNDKAPSFTLPNEKDKKTSLADYKGQWVVLYFYPKDLTPGCTQEACDFSKALPQFKKIKGVVLGVSLDSPDRHRKFIEKQALKFSLLSDEDAAVSKKYGVYKKKNLYGHEFMGIERTTFLISPKGTIAHIFPKVKVNGHVDEVTKTLKNLFSDQSL